MAEPNAPDPRSWQSEMGAIDSYWGGSFDDRNSRLLGATTGNFDQYFNSLIGGRQNEMTANAQWLRQNVPQLQRAGKSVQRLANKYTKPTALSREITGAGREALANPMAGNATLTELNSDASLLSTMRGQAADELALNGRLSAEGERAAQQGSRAAYAARGMGTSGAAALSEVLNRESHVQQRQDRARGFASSVTGQDLALSEVTQGAINSVRGFALGANSQDMARRQAALAAKTGAQQFKLGTNPNMMAFNSASMAPTALSAAMQTTGQADVYPQQLGYAANVNDFNANAEWSQYMNELNRYYAERYGGMGAAGGGGMGFDGMGAATGALTGAASGALMGAAVGGVGAIPGALIGGVVGGVGGGLGGGSFGGTAGGSAASLAGQYYYPGSGRNFMGDMQSFTGTVPRATAVY